VRGLLKGRFGSVGTFFICTHFSAWIQRELSFLLYLLFGGDQGTRSLWRTDPSKHKGGYVYVCMCECKARR
jgi:hypothetical protein